MASPIPPDPYKALGVRKNVDAESIKKAYRKLVLTCHPDKVKALDDAAKVQKADQFHQVQQAYEILSDEQKRTRYDDRVKLAELRADAIWSSALRGTGFDSSSRPSTFPRYETRENAVYEERVPRRSFEETYSTPRYDEHRSSTKKRDDRFEEPVAVRTRSGKLAQERKSPKERERDQEFEETDRVRTRTAKKQQEKYAFASSQKQRDRERRQDSETKRYRYHPDEFSHSDSDDAASARYSSRRSSDSGRKRETRESRRSRPSHDEAVDAESDEPKYKFAAKSAEDYIAMTSGKSPVAEQPSMSRRVSSRDARLPPPPLAPIPPYSGIRRSSASRTHVDKSRLGKVREVEIVDPAMPRRERERSDYEIPTRRPSLHTGASDPASFHIPSICRNCTVHRAATFDPRNPESGKSMPFNLRHAQTSPPTGGMLSGMLSPNGTTNPIKSSKLRHSETHHDSGYSSHSGPGTPEMSGGITSPHFSHTYYSVAEPDSDSDDRPSPRIVTVDPEPHHQRPQRSRSSRDEGDIPTRSVRRPSVGSRTSASRQTPARSSTYVDVPNTSGHAPSPRSGPRTPGERQREGLSGAGAKSPLFCEVREVQYSPKLDKSHILYSSRRGSTDDGRERDRDRGYSHFEKVGRERGGSPELVRSQSYVPGVK